MSIRSRRNKGNTKRGYRFIDDVTGQQGYSNRMVITEDGKMVRPENNDRPSTLKTTLVFPENEGYIDPKLVRPRQLNGNGFTKNPYDFQSPIFDRIETSTGSIIASLDPDIVLAQLEQLKTWEEMEVLWNAELGQFASPYWNPLISLNGHLYDNVYVFGDSTFVYDLDDEGGN